MDAQVISRGVEIEIKKHINKHGLDWQCGHVTQVDPWYFRMHYRSGALAWSLLLRLMVDV
jgi:hypothetical protein